MAKVKVTLPEEYIKKITHLGDKTDEIVGKVLEAGDKVVVEKVRGNLRGVIGRGIKFEGRSSGELLSSLGVTTPKVDRKGVHNVKVGFNEPRRNQYAAKKKRSYYTITNAMIANTIEYGKHGQPAKSFLKPARSASRKACVQAMQDALDEEIGKL